MRCIILAAGYATRLYPLTENFPKPLLPVAGKPILDRLVDKAFAVPNLDGVTVVSNDRFFSHFEEWLRGRSEAASIRLVNDGSRSNEERIGALRDLALGVEASGALEPTIVLAGDNLFDFDLRAFAAFFEERQADCITTHRLRDVEGLRRTGVIEVGPEWEVCGFEEKPKEPKSDWAVPPFYLYTAQTLREELPLFLEEGNEGDAPGRFIPWLLERKRVYAYPFEGERYDIGNVESYRRVREAFGEELDEA